MSPHIDYYKILGINETASLEEIKRVYRKLAKRYHPDSRGGDKAAEERFKKISEAYSVLGDKQKRQQYDLMRKSGFLGSEGFNFSGANPGSYQVDFGAGFAENIQDIFNNLFGGFNGGRQSPEATFGGSANFEDLFQQRRPSHSRGADRQSTITIPFGLAVNGGETIFKTGSNRKVKIKIPAGMEDGKKIRLTGHGASSRTGGESGDLYLEIKVAPSSEFERKGKDIYSQVYINIAEAILGTEVYANTVSGKKVKLKIPAGTSSAKVFRLRGLGVKINSGKGDHFVRIEIESPTNLSNSQKKEFKAWARKTGLIK